MQSVLIYSSSLDWELPYSSKYAHFQMSAELFTLTYGAFVTQMLKDYEDPQVVTAKLDKVEFV